ncbi:tubulin folding cofactor D C terminal-domain-containing protein [Peziza echinospora]|nr:tubulin folding cofactor D C terminal-domain-containing protein [Peziza echinospora]
MSEDAPEDREAKLQKVSKDLFSIFKDTLGRLLYKDGLGLHPSSGSKDSRPVNAEMSRQEVESCIHVLEPFQESPQILDAHLASIVPPILTSLLTYLTSPPVFTPTDKANYSLPEAIGRLVYALCKIRGAKIISRFFPNEPYLLQFIVTRFSFWGAEKPEDAQDMLEAAVESSWQFRYVMLLWLSLLLLTPFDLSTISTPPPDIITPKEKPTFIPPPGTPFPESLSALPQLSKALLQLAVRILPSPSPRESDAAALMIVRLAMRKDMRQLGVFDSVIEWCLRAWADEKEAADIDLLGDHTDPANLLFLRTGTLNVLAGLLTQSESSWLQNHIPRLWNLATEVEDKGSQEELDAEDTIKTEWSSSGVRRVITKIYRWIGIILLSPGAQDEEGIVENIVGRLLNLLGDRDTNVRFAVSKSLGVLTSKLPPEMANEVVNAVVGGYDENVLYETADEGKIPEIFGDTTAVGTTRRIQILASVSPEMWHGLTLTLATLLRQRAIVPTARADDEEDASTKELFQKIILRVLTALTFDQRRTTFSLGSNVRDAACYAAWSLARSYHTAELLSVPLPEEHFLHPYPASAGIENIIQLLATNLVATACLDSLGNIRRAASAALQELVGRHPNIVIEGINLIQAVDYGGVSVRRRAVTKIATAAAHLGEAYWFALVKHGLVDGWRGVGNGDTEGRRIAADGLGGLIGVSVSENEDPKNKLIRGKIVIGWLLERASNEARKDVEVRHGIYWALAEVIDAISKLPRTDGIEFFTEMQRELIVDVFYYLDGNDFVRLILRPELTAEAACRLVSAMCKASLHNSAEGSPLLPPLPIAHQRLYLAIIEASLDHRPEEPVLEKAIPASKDLFNILSLENQKNIVEGWCRRVLAEALNAHTKSAVGAVGSSGVSGLGRKRGLVSGLGEVLSVLIAEKNDAVVAKVVDVLVDAATRQGDVEMRVAGIRAITRGIMAKKDEDFDIGKFPGLAVAFYDGLDDYAVDSRGDVGSWVRMDCIKAVIEGWNSGALNFGLGEELMSGLIQRLVRLSVEKLDKLRSGAFEALHAVLYRPGIEAERGKKVEKLSDLGVLIDWSLPADVYTTSTAPEYYTALLPILTCPFPDVIEAFLTGYMLSSGSGSDSLLRASNSALWNYLDSDGVDAKQLAVVSERLAQILEKSIKDTSERITVPCLQTIGVGLETGVLAGDKAVQGGWGTAGEKKLFMAAQSAHKGSGSVGKLAGAVRVYRVLGISGGDVVRGLVIKKLVAMLGHPFPKVRSEVAEALYLVVTISGSGGEKEKKAELELEETDWMGKNVKAKVAAVKNLLVA